jgi:hypothetical protein
LAEDLDPESELFTQVPILRADSREDIEAFLGFRHVTGIKEWKPAEKAEYIARLLDGGRSYEEVMRIIGSKTPTVRRNYLAFKALMQLETAEDADGAAELVEERFSVFFLSLRENGVLQYLGVDPEASVDAGKTPVPSNRIKNLVRYSKWVFGARDLEPLFTDSRQVPRFARALESPSVIEYLETSRRPTFAGVLSRSGVEAEELRDQLLEATDIIEQVLSTVHLHVDHEEVAASVERLARGMAALSKHFTEIISIICSTTED